MHIPIENRWRVVEILIAIFLAFLVLLAILVNRVGLFHKEEVVVIESPGGQEEAIVLPVEKTLFEYIEITNGCGPHFEGACLNVRSGPGEDYPKIYQLRTGIVLKVGGKVERDGHVWYKIVFDEKIRYPERIKGDWYVAADYVRVLLDEGVRDLKDRAGANAKRIIVDRSEQMLYAYDGKELFVKEPISTGLELTPTPRGVFMVFKKMPSRYMQGPIPGVSDQEYDLPGVPWNLYFSYQGAVIHGAYWHENFGKQFSHGCVNLTPSRAHQLYDWADVGTRVIVQD